MDWAFVADNGGGQVELDAAKNRRVTWRLDDPADASFSIDGRNAQAGALTEMVTDLLVLADGTPIYRGTVGPTSDTVTADVHDVKVATADYRARLGRRILYDTNQLEWLNTDQFDLAWALIEETQGNPGGDLGITRGIGVASGVLRDREYEGGKNVGEALAQLGRVIDGYDWEVDALRRLNMWYPRRGNASGVVLDVGGVLAGVERAVDPGRFFTAGRWSGTDGLVPEVRDAADIATRPEGRWDVQVGQTDILEQATLAERADYGIEDGPVVLPSYVATFAAGKWGGPGHVWLGDTVTMVVMSPPRLLVNAPMRVYEMSASIDANNQATITATIGSPSPDFTRRLPELSRRVTDLERR